MHQHIRHRDTCKPQTLNNRKYLTCKLINVQYQIWATSAAHPLHFLPDQLSFNNKSKPYNIIGGCFLIFFSPVIILNIHSPNINFKFLRNCIAVCYAWNGSSNPINPTSCFKSRGNFFAKDSKGNIDAHSALRRAVHQGDIFNNVGGRIHVHLATLFSRFEEKEGHEKS